MTNTQYKLNQKTHKLMYQSLFSKTFSHKAQFIEIFGYTPKQLRNHLEQLFQPGMTWDNKDKWQIDHIVPKCSFEYESTKDISFQLCWDIRNIQPLWEQDNRVKGSTQNGIWPNTSRLALNNQARIVWYWENGAKTSDLMKYYKTSQSTLRRLIIEFVGIEAFKKTTSARMRARKRGRGI